MLEDYNLAALKFASVGTLVWLGISVLYCVKFRKKRFRFNAKSWKSWVYIGITISIFTALLTTCECTDQTSISKGSLTSLNPSTMEPYPTATIECGNPLSVIEVKKLVDRSVTLNGEFSLAGKSSPFVICGDEVFYYEISLADTSQYQQYQTMEGKTVRVTGVLRFRGYKRPAGNLPLPYQIPPDHFYFDESVKIELQN